MYIQSKTKMNLNNNSSSSSSSSGDDDCFNNALLNIILMNQSIEEQEDFIIQFTIQKHIESTSGGKLAQKKKRKFINRKCGDAEERLMNDYFVERPLYS